MRSIKSGESIKFATWRTPPNGTYKWDNLESDFLAIVDGKLCAYDDYSLYPCGGCLAERAIAKAG